MQTENHAGQQRGDLRPYVTWDRFVDDGLGTRTRFDITSAFRPGLHPGGHPAPEKKRQAETFAARRQRTQGLVAELLVVGNQIWESCGLAKRLAQRRFF